MSNVSDVPIFPHIYRSILSYLRLSYHIFLKLTKSMNPFTNFIYLEHIHTSCLSIQLSYTVCLSFFIYHLSSVSTHLTICPSIYLSTNLSIYLSIYLSTVCTCLLVYRSINPTLNVNVTVGTRNLHIYMPVYLSAYNICMGTSVCFCICLSLIR